MPTAVESRSAVDALQLWRCVHERALVDRSRERVHGRGLLVGSHFYLVCQLGDHVVFLPKVRLHGFQVRFKQRVLLHCVVSLLLQRDSLCVQLLLLKGLNVVRDVLLARCVISRQVVRES